MHICPIRYWLDFSLLTKISKYFFRSAQGQQVQKTAGPGGAPRRRLEAGAVAQADPADSAWYLYYGRGQGYGYGGNGYQSGYPYGYGNIYTG